VEFRRKGPSLRSRTQRDKSHPYCSVPQRVVSDDKSQGPTLLRVPLQFRSTNQQNRSRVSVCHRVLLSDVSRCNEDRILGTRAQPRRSRCRHRYRAPLLVRAGGRCRICNEGLVGMGCCALAVALSASVHQNNRSPSDRSGRQTSVSSSLLQKWSASQRNSQESPSLPR